MSEQQPPATEPEPFPGARPTEPLPGTSSQPGLPGPAEQVDGADGADGAERAVGRSTSPPRPGPGVRDVLTSRGAGWAVALGLAGVLIGLSIGQATAGSGNASVTTASVAQAGLPAQANVIGPGAIQFLPACPPGSVTTRPGQVTIGPGGSVTIGPSAQFSVRPGRVQAAVPKGTVRVFVGPGKRQVVLPPAVLRTLAPGRC